MVNPNAPFWNKIKEWGVARDNPFTITVSPVMVSTIPIGESLYFLWNREEKVEDDEDDDEEIPSSADIVGDNTDVVEKDRVLVRDGYWCTDELLLCTPLSEATKVFNEWIVSNGEEEEKGTTTEEEVDMPNEEKEDNEV